MNYTIEEYVFNDYNASSKARKDVSYFVLQNGFQSLFKNDKSKIRDNKIAKIILSIKLYIKLFKLRQDDILFVQTSTKILKTILKIKKVNNFRLIYLIHDLFSLRYNTQESIKTHLQEIEKDIALMSQCDIVIAHNDVMVQRLKDFGCSCRLISLGIFDYSCKLSAKKRKLSENEIVQIAFAGYLGKSPFLKHLDEQKHNYQLIVYGLPPMKFEYSIYKGSVDADILPKVIEGHLGLIWEGDYNVQEKDNYTCINNPHKLSMYIVAGLPIIAWKRSAAALFIEKNNIGITIQSLDELDSVIKNLSTKDYQLWVNNCLKIREKLIQGYYIHRALSLHDLKANLK